MQFGRNRTGKTSFMTKLIKSQLGTAREPVLYYKPRGQLSLGPSGKLALPFKNDSGSGSLYHQAKIVRITGTLIPTVLWLLFDFLSLKIFVNVASKSNKQKTFFLNLFFVGVLKVNDENSKIRIRIRIHLSEVWIRGSGSGSTPTCHRSATLLLGPINTLFTCVPEPRPQRPHRWGTDARGQSPQASCPLWKW